MSYFLNLPDELIMKIMSYTETVDILRCGGVSKRIRIISNDSSLFQSVNLSGKIVKADFLETVLNKDCISLNLSNSFIRGNLTLTQKSQLIKLDLSYCHEISYDVLEELLESCHSLQILSLNGLQLPTQIYQSPLEQFSMVHFTSESVGNRVIELLTQQYKPPPGSLGLTPKIVACICKNSPTLQVLNLKEGITPTVYRNGIFCKMDTGKMDCFVNLRCEVYGC